MPEESYKPDWDGDLVVWKDHATWVNKLSDWIQEMLGGSPAETIASLGPQDLYWDDGTWLQIFEGALGADRSSLAAELGQDLSVGGLRVYHATRVHDAGIFRRDGLKINDPAEQAEAVRKVVTEEEELAFLRPTLEQRLSSFAKANRDRGWLSLSLDDRPHFEDSAFLIYGSEWQMVFLGELAWPVLRQRGVPTMLEIDIPMDWVRSESRAEFAMDMLQEWTRVKANSPDWSPGLDFTINLEHDVPPSRIVSHYHPASVKDWRYGGELRSGWPTSCPACASKDLES